MWVLSALCAGRLYPFLPGDNSKTPWGIEPATFRFVVQFIDQLRHRVQRFVNLSLIYFASGRFTV
jgi:hypothetical protein